MTAISLKSCDLWENVNHDTVSKVRKEPKTVTWQAQL